MTRRQWVIGGLIGATVTTLGQWSVGRVVEDVIARGLGILLVLVGLLLLLGFPVRGLHRRREGIPLLLIGSGVSLVLWYEPGANFSASDWLIAIGGLLAFLGCVAAISFYKQLEPHEPLPPLPPRRYRRLR